MTRYITPGHTSRRAQNIFRDIQIFEAIQDMYPNVHSDRGTGALITERLDKLKRQLVDEVILVDKDEKYIIPAEQFGDAGPKKF